MTGQRTPPWPDATSDPLGIAAAREQLSLYLRDVLVCLQRYVGRYAHRMLQAGGTLNDLYVSFSEVATVLGHAGSVRADESVASRMGWPNPEVVARQLWEHQAAAETRRRELLDAHDVQMLPIENLRRLFHLSERQIRLLLAAAAPLFSVDLSRLYGFAWADFATKRPWVGFLAELLADTPEELPELVAELRDHAPLVRYRLLELRDVPAWGAETPLMHRAVHVPDRIAAYLASEEAPLPGRIADTCHLRSAQAALAREELVLPEAVAHEVELALRRALDDPRGRPRLLLVGAEGAGRATAVRTLLAPNGWGVFEVDLGRLVPEGPRFEESLVEICREALLRRCLLLVQGDRILADRAQLAELSRPLSRVLEPYEGPLALASSQRAPLLHQLVSDLHEVTVPLPSAAEQRGLWERATVRAGCALEPDASALLTQRFNVSPGAIHRAVEEARGRAALFSRGGAAFPLRAADLGQAIRRRTVHALGAIAEPFSTTLTWDDVVLHEPVLKTLREILSQAKHREKVYDEWGFAQKVTYGRGLSCLFSGPPGTGKTMMAAVLAQTLGRELYRVDLSRIVSKWVGETEKNLAAAFDEAERGQLVLLFDEADALFSKRTKTQTSNDRFANMEINYLLQRMEAYDGMTVLTTNKEKAIDEAFKRRLKFKVDFPMPDPPLRARLWRSMIPDGLPVEADLPFDDLGREFEMAGGNIKNAVVRAAFYAAEDDSELTADHLYRAALQEAREMGMMVRDESG